MTAAAWFGGGSFAAALFIEPSIASDDGIQPKKS
jgi:hypothetical protein